MTGGAFSPEVCELVIVRSNRRCERCGLSLERAHFHHRDARGMGGTSLDRLGFASNCLLLHPRCHQWIEDHPRISTSLGHMVVPPDVALEVPVRLWDGWFLLDDMGGLTSVTVDVPSTSPGADRFYAPRLAGGEPLASGPGG